MDVSNSKIWRTILPIFTLILLVVSYIFPTDKPVIGSTTIIDDNIPLAELSEAFFYAANPEEVSFDDISLLTEEMFDYIGIGTVFYEYDIYDDSEEVASTIASAPDFSAYISEGQTIDWRYVVKLDAGLVVGGVYTEITETPEEIENEEIPEEYIEPIATDYYLYNPVFYRATTTAVSPYMCRRVGSGSYYFEENVYNDPDTVFSQIAEEPDYSAPRGRYIEWGSAFEYHGKYAVIGKYEYGEKPVITPRYSTTQPVDDSELFIVDDIEPEVTDETTNSESAESPKTYDESARLSVSGSKIYDGNGNQVLLRGFGSEGGEFMATKWDTWYNNESIATIQGLGANIFRLMVEISYYHDQGDPYAQEYCNYVDRFVDNNMYCIVSWMGNTDFDSRTDDAIAFFDYVTNRYGDNPYVLYEIANEPFDRSWEDVKAYADIVIPSIRENAPSALVIVPSTFSYRGEKSNAPIINNPLEFDNVIYQEHMYVGSILKTSFLDGTTDLVDAGYPVIFTEWGATDANGRDNYYNDYSIAFLKYCELHDINWCNFQLSDFRPRSGIYQSSTHQPGMWTNDLDEDTLSYSGKMIKSYFANGYVEPTASTMMNYKEGYAFWEDSIRQKITNIYFVSDDNFDGSYDISWDISMSQGSEDVMAYLDGTVLYIVAKNGPVLAPRSNDYVFKNFTSLKELSLDNYDTRYVNYTNALFSGCKSLEEIDLSNYDTSQLTTFSSEFLNCNKLKEIDLRDSDLSNVKSFENAFYNCHSLEKLYLPDLDADAINNTTRAYKNLGKNSPSTEIIYTDNSDEDAFTNATY